MSTQPPGEPVTTERIREIADAMEDSWGPPDNLLGSIEQEVAPALRSLADQREALEKERDAVQGQIQHLKDCVVDQVDIAKAAAWDIDEVKAEREALRAKLAEAEKRSAFTPEEVNAEIASWSAKVEQAEARAERAEQALARLHEAARAMILGISIHNERRLSGPIAGPVVDDFHAAIQAVTPPAEVAKPTKEDAP